MCKRSAGVYIVVSGIALPLSYCMTASDWLAVRNFLKDGAKAGSSGIQGAHGLGRHLLLDIANIAASGSSMVVQTPDSGGCYCQCLAPALSLALLADVTPL